MMLSCSPLSFPKGAETDITITPAEAEEQSESV